MSAIVTKIVEKYNLNPEMGVSDLSKYTSEFFENLTDDRKRNQAHRRLRDGFNFSSEQPPKSSEEEIIREITKRILQNRYGFSKDQVDDLFSIQKNVQPKSKTMHEVNIVISKRQSYLSSKDWVTREAIGEMAHRLLRDKLSIQDIRAEAYTLALSAKNANASSSHITEEANEIQQNQRKFGEAFEKIDYLDHFTLESVKERLDSYDTSSLPDLQALADVMIMLCIRPAELITLRITNAEVTGYAKNRGQANIPQKFRSMEKNQERAKELLTWIQRAISSGRIGNSGKPGVKWFNRFLKDYGLIPKYLRKMGAVYGVVIHETENMAHAYTIAGECLLHSSDNHSLLCKITL
ncbi:11950_t:CDS:2 [Gigaspora rosea]|nr:11950_t:CDS:2 [Gigaspora rosea]